MSLNAGMNWKGRLINIEKIDCKFEILKYRLLVILII